MHRAGECSPALCPDFYYGMVLCNDAAAGKGDRTGDPTELALLDLAVWILVHRFSTSSGAPLV